MSLILPDDGTRGVGVMQLRLRAVGGRTRWHWCVPLPAGEQPAYLFELREGPILAAGPDGSPSWRLHPIAAVTGDRFAIALLQVMTENGLLYHGGALASATALAGTSDPRALAAADCDPKAGDFWWWRSEAVRTEHQDCVSYACRNARPHAFPSGLKTGE